MLTQRVPDKSEKPTWSSKTNPRQGTSPHDFAASIALSALSLGTLSPKNTTLKIYASRGSKISLILRKKMYHLHQALVDQSIADSQGIIKSSSQNFSSISISPSGLCCMPKTFV